MNELLEKALDAHGGLDRWRTYESVHATIVSGGQLWDLKKVPQDPTPREMRVATQREWASLSPYGSADQETDFTPERIAIQKLDGTVVSERFHPAKHAEGHAVDAPWDALDRAYFNGYALWTYLTTPFLFALRGFASEEIDSWGEKGETWRGLRVTFPRDIASHSKRQDFYFGPDFLLRRHDYHVDASGGFAAAQYVSDAITVQGITATVDARFGSMTSTQKPPHGRPEALAFTTSNRISVSAIPAQSIGSTITFRDPRWMRSLTMPKGRESKAFDAFTEPWDPVLHRMTQMVLPSLQDPHRFCELFLDYFRLLFCAHIARTYAPSFEVIKRFSGKGA